jgi:tetratricopeptide (TPR) repeat protein/tRNA A-37 threonylcarbamoyl transferase component Bud32
VRWTGKLGLVDESTVDDPSAPGPGGLDFDATSAAVLGGLFGEAKRPRVGRYEVLRPLGSGAMGRVFAARDVELDREVALKLLHVERGQDTKARGRFLREARALARVSHPNVVEVFEVGVHEGDVFIAMELLRGKTLRAWVKAEERSAKEVLRVLIGVAEGLAAAHRAGLVHRDVKPANVWVGDDGRPRVIDFGLAMTERDVLSETNQSSSSASLREALDAASSKLTRTGAMVGSPAYMAPEQLTQGRANEASDQFSFCITAFEALHGQRPFVGTTPLQLLEAMQRGSISRTDDDTPWWIDRILARGLEFGASARWPKMEALVAALRRGPRRRWLAGGTAAVGLSALAAFAARPIPIAEGCARHELSAWNADVRGRVAVRTGAPSEAFERDIAGPIDRWAEGWSSEHAVMCDAGPDAEAFDETLHCLDVVRTQFTETVALFDALEVGQVAEAVRLAGVVDGLPTCTEPEGRVDDDAMRVAARVIALDAAGRWGEAIRVGREALPDVREPRSRALLLGTMASAAGSADLKRDAAAFAEESYFLALRVGDETRAIRSAAEVVSAVGTLGELDAAKRWHALGVARVEFAADPTASSGRLDEALGVALYYGGKPAEAVEAYDRAVEAAGTSNPLRLASLQGDRGNALVDAGRLVEGRAALTKALDSYIDTHGPDHPTVATGHTNLGAAFAISGEFDQAKPHFAEALRITRIGEPEPKGLGMALGNMGLAAHSAGDYEEAQAFLEEALSEFEKSGDPTNPRVLFTLNNLAVNAQARGDFEGAERQLWSLLERKRTAFGPDHDQVGRTYDALGDNDLRQQQYAEAEPHFREALRIFEAALGAEHPDLVYPLIGLGRCASELGRHDEAIATLRRGVRLGQREGVDPSLLHDVRVALGKAFFAAGEQAEGRRVLSEARASAIEREDSSHVDQVDDLLKR